MIPRRLVRVVPEQTSEEVERWWAEACALHPSWEHVTLRDPIDPAGFPNTRDKWDIVRSGAQLADLVRYDELYCRGGIYLDSDVQLFKPLDSLLQLGGFAAWEDSEYIPNAVIGFEPEHPALARIIKNATEAMPDSTWKTGVWAITEVLKDRPHDNVLVLPPESFYAVHYRTKAILGTPGFTPEEIKARQPWAFGLHWYRHSWVGTDD